MNSFNERVDVVTNARILLVEDESIIALDLKSRLVGMGYEVAAVASSGEEALRQAERLGLDLVLMDIVLHGALDGVQTAARLRDRFDLPVIYLTAFSDEGTLRRAQVTEPFGYILKPFEDRELRTAIAIALHKHGIEKRLRESEARFRRLSENAQDIIYRFEFTPRPRFAYVNPAASAIAGYAPDEFYADPELFLKIVHPDDLPEVMSMVRRDIPLDALLTLRWITKPGRIIWVESRSVLVYDEAGQVAAVEGIARDVTARILAETAEREQRALAETLRDTAAALIRTLNLDEVLDYIVDSVGRVAPSDAANVMLVDELHRVAHVVRWRGYAEQGLEHLVRARRVLVAEAASLQQAAASRQPVVIADTLVDPDESDPPEMRRLRSRVCVPICAQGRLVGFLNLASAQPGCLTPAHAERLQALADQAALAVVNVRLFEAERRQRDLAEALRDTAAAINRTLNLDEVFDLVLVNLGRVVPHDAAAILLIDADGGTARVVRRTGYAPPTQAAGVDGLRLDLASAPVVQRMVESASPVAIPDTQAEPDWRALPEMDWVRSFAAAPIRLKRHVIGFLHLGGAVSGFYTPAHAGHLQAFADQAAIAIENARLYQALQDQFQRAQESQAQLIHAEKMAALGRLTASLAHEINNPLQAVQGCLSLVKEELAEGLNPEEMKRDLEVASVEIERISRIVQRLRDFVRPERGGLRSTDVHAALDSVLELTHKQLQHSRVRVERDWAARLGCVWANPDQLRQVFLNLVLNAVDAMPNGGTLRVSTIPEDLLTGAQRPGARVAFRDSGAGIPPEVLSRIFEPLFTTKDSGTGLGLSISYEIIKAFGGAIRVASQVGVGTTFDIVLPVAEA